MWSGTGSQGQTWIVYTGTAAGDDAEPATGGVREPRRPKPPTLSPGHAAEPPREEQGLCLTAAPLLAS